MTSPQLDAVAAWMRHVGDITPEEVAALLPIVQSGHGRLRGLVLAYRAGIEHGRTLEHADICDCDNGPGVPR